MKRQFEFEPTSPIKINVTTEKGKIKIDITPKDAEVKFQGKPED